VLRRTLLKIVANSGCPVDSDVILITRDVLVVKVGRGGPEGRREFVNEEGGYHGEAGDVLLACLGLEVHFSAY